MFKQNIVRGGRFDADAKGRRRLRVNSTLKLANSRMSSCNKNKLDYA